MEAVCVIRPERGSRVTGTVRFLQESRDASVSISVDLKGFARDGEFGFHIHRYGNTTGGCASMCEHFDANRNKTHGGPDDANRHLGDLGNIRVRNRACKRTIDDRMLSLFGLAGKRSIVGRGVVVHEKRDDLGRGGNAESLVTGNAGKRVACGVIALATDLY